MMKKGIRNFLSVFVTTALFAGIMLINPLDGSSAAETTKQTTTRVAETKKQAVSGKEAPLEVEMQSSIVQASVSGLVPNDQSAGKNNITTFNQILKQAAANGTTELIVPKGTYYLDASYDYVTNERDISVDMISNMVLDFNGATFIQSNSSSPAYTLFSILFCENVTFKNGTLIGDAPRHNYTFAGGTHELGFGIRIASSKNITITDMDIYEFTGDSILIDGRGSYMNPSAGIIPDNIKILNSKLHDNRRQGLSVTGSNNLLVSGCEIYNIGQFRGTPPMAGIDLESDMGWGITNTVIENNRFYNNANSAVTMAWCGKESANAKNTLIQNNDVEGSVSVGYGDGAIIRGNMIRDDGIYVSDTDIPTNTLVEYNTLENASIRIVDNAWVDVRHNTIFDGQISFVVSGGVAYGNTISNEKTKTPTDYAIRINTKKYEASGEHNMYCFQNVVRGEYQFPVHFLTTNVKVEMPPANSNSQRPTPTTAPTPVPTPAPTPVPLPSQDKVTGFVTRLYQTGLGREPDTFGLAFWRSGLMSNVMTGAKAAENFLHSEEFQNKRLSDSDYIDVLYQALMDRKSDADGKAYWQSCLDSGSGRTGILRQFLYSGEFQNLCNTYGISRGEPSVMEARDVNLELTRFVHRQYKEILGRNSDVSGLNHWVTQIQKGSSPADVSGNFVFSEEFIKANYNDEDFLKILYRAFMGREADPGGLSHWKDEFKRGKSRQDVFASFAYSKEFKNIAMSFGM